MNQKAVFIDRDGTLVEEVNYLHRVEDLRFFPFTDESVRMLKELGFLVIMVTNQSGIGRGVYSENDMHSVNARIQSDLSVELDAIFFCPHLPDAGCLCRKPSTGMLEAARARFQIDVASSWMIGDKPIDVEFGRRGGLRSILVRTGYGRDAEIKGTAAEFVAENLLEAVNHIVKNSR